MYVRIEQDTVDSCAFCLPTISVLGERCSRKTRKLKVISTAARVKRNAGEMFSTPGQRLGVKALGQSSGVKALGQGEK